MDGVRPPVRALLEAVFSMALCTACTGTVQQVEVYSALCTALHIVIPSVQALTSLREFLLKTRNIASLVSQSLRNCRVEM